MGSFLLLIIIDPLLLQIHDVWRERDDYRYASTLPGYIFTYRHTCTYKYMYCHRHCHGLQHVMAVKHAITLKVQSDSA